MSDETIELLKNYDPDKMKWPAGIQQKLDGVPVIISNTLLGGYEAHTRRGECVRSIPHILHEIAHTEILSAGKQIVGELYIRGEAFKDISGKVRRHLPSTDLRLYCFDYNNNTNAGWASRMVKLRGTLNTQALEFTSCIPWYCCSTAQEAERAHKVFMENYPKAEGSVLHSLDKQWEPGKRSWLVQRMKDKPTLDLRVVNFEEAVSKTGEPLGRVGRINVELVQQSGDRVYIDIVGVGPGKLSHIEATELWQHFGSGPCGFIIAEVQYMADDAYAALRQPTFQRWRGDKSTPDTYVRD